MEASLKSRDEAVEIFVAIDSDSEYFEKSFDQYMMAVEKMVCDMVCIYRWQLDIPINGFCTIWCFENESIDLCWDKKLSWLYL